jgi:hypothetical protein
MRLFRHPLTTGVDLQGSGDGTVLIASATLLDRSQSPSVKSFVFNGIGHGALPNSKSVINQILTILKQTASDKSLVNPFAELY